MNRREYTGEPSNFNQLYHGAPCDAIDVLDHNEATEQELRAALVNVFRRIDRLEAEVKRLREGE